MRQLQTSLVPDTSGPSLDRRDGHHFQDPLGTDGTDTASGPLSRPTGRTPHPGPHGTDGTGDRRDGHRIRGPLRSYWTDTTFRALSGRTGQGPTGRAPHPGPSRDRRDRDRRDRHHIRAPLTTNRTNTTSGALTGLTGRGTDGMGTRTSPDGRDRDHTWGPVWRDRTGEKAEVDRGWGPHRTVSWGPTSSSTVTQRTFWGSWVALSVERLTLNLGSGHDLTVWEIEPHVGLLARCGACSGFSLSLSLCPCAHTLRHSLAHSLSQNKK